MQLGTGRAEIALALGVLALAAVVAWQTTEIPVTPLYSRIGPRIFPVAIVGGLTLLGVLLLVQGIAGGWRHDAEEEHVPPDWPAIGWLLLGLVLNVALIKHLGFVIASTLLFCCVARAFGSTRILRDAAIAILFSVLVFVGFERGLGLSIGAGILEGVL